VILEGIQRGALPDDVLEGQVVSVVIGFPDLVIDHFLQLEE
jgi:hypothetical protein